MPKPSRFAVAWSPERQCYELRENTATILTLGDDGSAWQEWLQAHTSFAFEGEHRRINLLREARKGVGYWYAYRRVGKRVEKQYVGRSDTVTPERLQTIAATLGQPSISQEQPPEVVPQPAPLPVESSIVGEHTAPIPLLAAKLQPPRLQQNLLRRDALLAKLDAGWSRRLMLMCAPAGFGKTTIVRQWIAERAADLPPVAWIALEPSDDDPLVFLRYLITACQRFGAGVGATSLSLLQTVAQVPFKQSSYDAAIVALLNELADGEHRGIVVLEDYHVLSAPAIHAVVTFFIEHLPASLHLIIISRLHPAVPLILLRATGDVTEIYAGDLLFSPDEARRFIHQLSGSTIPPDLEALILERNEGWPAGLRLLTVALEAHSDRAHVEAVLREFGGRYAAIQEYVVREVLDEQPEAVRAFLLETSVLARLNASLCDTVRGRTDSADLLNVMDRGNILLEPLDEANLWYRYHALFATVILHEARRLLGAERLRILARRAEEWFDAHDMQVEAIDTLLQADDAAYATTRIVALVDTLNIIYGKHGWYPGLHTFGRWLAQLPRAMFDAHPYLLVLWAMALVLSTPQQEVSAEMADRIDALLHDAEQRFRATDERNGLGEVFALRSMIQRQRGDTVRAATWAREALALLHDDHLGGRSICMNSLGFHEIDTGRLDEAERWLREALALCERIGNHAYIRANRAMLGLVFFDQGRLYQADVQLGRVLVEAREQQDVDDIARAQHVLSDIAYEWNDLAGARRKIEESLDLRQRFLHIYEEYQAGTLLLLRIMWAEGDHDGAIRRANLLLTQTERYHTPFEYATYRQICCTLATMYLRADDLVAARRIHARLVPQPAAVFQRTTEAALEARLRLADDDAVGALRILDDVRTMLHPSSGRHVLAIQTLLVLAQAAAGNTAEAQRVLYDVLAAAYSEGYMRLLLDEGAAMAALLRHLLPAIREKHLAQYARQLLRAFAAPTVVGATAGDAARELSQQERRVLVALTAGRSNADIAAEMIVSINTVKAHVKRIYRKLGITNRVEAVAAARGLSIE